MNIKWVHLIIDIIIFFVTIRVACCCCCSFYRPRCCCCCRRCEFRPTGDGESFADLDHSSGRRVQPLYGDGGADRLTAVRRVQTAGHVQHQRRPRLVDLQLICPRTRRRRRDICRRILDRVIGAVVAWHHRQRWTQWPRLRQTHECMTVYGMAADNGARTSVNQNQNRNRLLECGCPRAGLKQSHYTCI